MDMPTTIRTTCYGDGLPLAGMFVSITLKTRHKNDFGCISGPTSADGVVTAMWEEIERWAELDRNTFPMDYTGLGDLTGEIVVRPLNRDALDRALKAYRLFGAGVAYPSGYAEGLRKAREILERAGQMTLSVQVQHDGVGVTVQTCDLHV